MPKTVSASEAKNRFGSMVEWAIKNQDEVIIQSYGEPRAVLVPFEAYQRVLELREQARRREALERLEQLRETIQARNRDLSGEEADALADRFTREVIGEMAPETQVFHQDR